MLKKIVRQKFVLIEPQLTELNNLASVIMAANTASISLTGSMYQTSSSQHS